MSAPLSGHDAMASLSPSFRPKLRKFARVTFDPVREKNVLLYPEGAIILNDTASEILALCDGARTIADIAAELGAKYQADVLADVTEYLADLARRDLVRDGQ